MTFGHTIASLNIMIIIIIAYYKLAGYRVILHDILSLLITQKVINTQQNCDSCLPLTT